MLRRWLPEWMRDYPQSQLATDVMAGLVVAVLVIPQSLAYALLAGLPPQVGLYVSIFPVMVYVLFGSSRVQAVGPAAIPSLMTAALLAPHALAGTASYVTMAATLALLAGVILLLCGLFRLGFLSQLLSRPVIAGFVSGSAVLIVLSQLGPMLGVPVSVRGWRDLPSLIAGMADISLATLIIGLLSLAVLGFTHFYLGAVLVRSGVPAVRAVVVVRLMPLVVLAAMEAVVVIWRLDQQNGVAVVGTVVEGLPPLALFLPQFSTVTSLFLPAVILALVLMVQGISVAQAMAIRRRERIDVNAELTGLGGANVMAAFYGGLAVGGGLTRSAINAASGARTQLASLVTALAMIGLAVGLAPLLSRLPLAALSAAIIVAALSLVDVASLQRSWRYDRADAIAWLGTALGVLLFGLEVGIMAGVLLSMAVLLYHTSQPHIAVIGRIAGSEYFRNVDRHDVETMPGVMFLRVDEKLFFGNLAQVERRISHELEQAALHETAVRDLVLVMNAVNRMDSTAVDVFCELNDDLEKRGVRLHLAEIKGPVQDRLKRSALLQRLSGECFLSANMAYERLARRGRSWRFVANRLVCWRPGRA